MRKNSPRTKKLEPMAPKVLSRYLRAPTASCHDHCKCETKQTIETKPMNSFPKRIPKAPPVDRTKLNAAQSVPRIKKAPSIVPKTTTHNVKNNNVVKDQILKRDVCKYSSKKVDVAIEPKSRDLKPKQENSQAKTYISLPSSTTSGRRHSDVFLPGEETLTLPSSRISKRRLSISGIFVHQTRDIVSVSKVSTVRGSSVSKNESRKTSKLPLVSKRSNSLKPSVSSPKKGVKMPPLRTFRSLQKPELKVSRKLKPSKPIEKVVPEKFLHVIEHDNGVETTITQNLISPYSCSNSEEKVMSNDHNDQLHECSSSVEDDTTATEGQNNENVADSEVNDTKVVVPQVGNLVVEIRDDCALENLKFRRGAILSPQSENSSPRKLQFRKGKELDENQTVKIETKSLRRMSSDGVVRIPESHTISVELKHHEMEQRKDHSSLFNNVIEETASKLIQARKTKVQALVGAFENIVSSKK